MMTCVRRLTSLALPSRVESFDQALLICSEPKVGEVVTGVLVCRVKLT
jgi:hypothetical protein